MQHDDDLGPLVPYEDRGLTRSVVSDVPPAIFAEQALLAALLCRPSNFDVLPDAFGPQHFAFDDHAAIFEAGREAARSGARHLSPAIEAALPHLAGPSGYVRQVVAAVLGAHPQDVVLYAETLIRMDERRRLLSLAEEIRNLASQPEGVGQSNQQIVAHAMDHLDGIVAAQRTTRGVITLAEAMGNAIRLGEEAYKRGDGLAGVTTGFRCWDRRMRGFLRGTMHVVAGRPGMGKTALMLRSAISAARAGNVVLIISLEMEAEQLAQRALALLAGMSLDEVLSGSFAEENSAKATEQALRLVRAQQEMAALALDIEDAPALTPAAIKLRIKAAVRRHGRVDETWVDHLHLTGKSQAAQRHGDTYAISENADALLAAAKEYGTAMIVLAQLSRGVETREEKRPTLSDLRQSGKIEENAFSVTFIYRNDYYTALASQEPRAGESEEKWQQRVADMMRIAQNTAGKAELIVAKLRMGGGPGTEHLFFDGTQTRFFEEEDRA